MGGGVLTSESVIKVNSNVRQESKILRRGQQNQCVAIKRNHRTRRGKGKKKLKICILTLQT